MKKEKRGSNVTNMKIHNSSTFPLLRIHSRYSSRVQIRINDSSLQLFSTTVKFFTIIEPQPSDVVCCAKFKHWDIALALPHILGIEVEFTADVVRPVLASTCHATPLSSRFEFPDRLIDRVDAAYRQRHPHWTWIDYSLNNECGKNRGKPHLE